MQGSLDRDWHPAGTGPQNITQSPLVRPPENLGPGRILEPPLFLDSSSAAPFQSRAGPRGGAAQGRFSMYFFNGPRSRQTHSRSLGGRGLLTPVGPAADSHWSPDGPSAQLHPGRACSGWGQGRVAAPVLQPGPLLLSPPFLCEAEDGCPRPSDPSDPSELLIPGSHCKGLADQ